MTPYHAGYLAAADRLLKLVPKDYALHSDEAKSWREGFEDATRDRLRSTLAVPVLEPEVRR